MKWPWGRERPGADRATYRKSDFTGIKEEHFLIARDPGTILEAQAIFTCGLVI
jgi:hypothetical protein